MHPTTHRFCLFLFGINSCSPTGFTNLICCSDYHNSLLLQIIFSFWVKFKSQIIWNSSHYCVFYIHNWRLQNQQQFYHHHQHHCSPEFLCSDSWHSETNNKIIVCCFCYNNDTGFSLITISGSLLFNNHIANKATFFHSSIRISMWLFNWKELYN